jgi:cholesterol oxidase
MPTGMTQATIPGVVFRAPDREGRHTFSMVNPLPLGFENFMTFFLTMTESPEAGHFVYDPVTDTVELKWAPEQSEPAVKSARFVFDKINRANGTSYHAGGMFGGPLLGDRSTYHPVGGCPLGEATDDYGRVAPYPGLYVMDGSLIPVGLCANPALTITALAERNIERILAEDFA